MMALGTWSARIASAGVALLCAAACVVTAQTPAPDTGDAFGVRTRKTGRPSRRAAPRRPPPAPAPEERGPALLAGNSVVEVEPGSISKEIRLGLAPGGVVMLEFPAGDKKYSVHPGDENLVTYTDTPRPSDPVVLRPGIGFAPPSGRGAPTLAATVTVQMESGFVAIIQIYPVRDLSRSASRVVLSYDRAKVVAARLERGLAANLNGPALVRPEQPAPDAAKLAPPSPPKSSEVSYNPAAARPASGAPRAWVEVAISREKKPPTGATKDLAALTHDELTKVIEKPSKYLGKFGSAVYGLQLAAAPSRDVDPKRRIVVFAIRNTTKADIRLVEGQPELYLETLDGEQRPVNIEHVRVVRLESTAVDRLIPAAGICYYAVIYETPVMGTRQRLRISASSVNAADAPAEADISPSLQK